MICLWLNVPFSYDFLIFSLFLFYLLKCIFLLLLYIHSTVIHPTHHFLFCPCHPPSCPTYSLVPTVIVLVLTQAGTTPPTPSHPVPTHHFPFCPHPIILTGWPNCNSSCTDTGRHNTCDTCSSKSCFCEANDVPNNGF